MAASLNDANGMYDDLLEQWRQGSASPTRCGYRIHLMAASLNDANGMYDALLEQWRQDNASPTVLKRFACDRPPEEILLVLEHATERLADEHEMVERLRAALREALAWLSVRDVPSVEKYDAWRSALRHSTDS